MKNGWLAELDYLRFFAIFGVICLHVFGSIPYTLLNILGNTNQNETLTHINEYIVNFSSYAIPLFIIISGFVLTYNYNKNFKIVNFYYKRLVKIVPPYIFISLITILGFAIFSGFPSYYDILFKLITASASDPLWFIALIIQLYLLYPLIIKIFEYFESKNKTAIFILTILIIQVIWIAAIKEIFIQTVYSPTSFILANRIFLSYIFYFAFGIVLSKNYPKILLFLSKTSPIFFGGIAFLISLVPVQYFHFNFLVNIVVQIGFVISLVMFLFQISISFKNYSNITSGFIRSVGVYSFGIYLIHPFIQYILIIGLFKIGINTQYWYFYPIQLVLLLLLSYLVIYEMVKIPYSEFFIGVKRQSF